MEKIYAIETNDLSIHYGAFTAVKGVNIKVEKQKITAIIGPSGCGKSTLLRAFNRMNDFVPGCRATGELLLQGQNLYNKDIDPVEVRRKIGMVFQKPNPFPKSIYENIAWGARINGYKGNMDQLVEQSLHSAALWDEVKDKLQQSAYALSGGQQQRLCIARTIAIRPGPDLNLAHRRVDAGIKKELYNSDRHSQYAASRARFRLHCHDDDRRTTFRRRDRIRRNKKDIHPPERQTH
jgi:ABC-type phosphate transport system ATPase subunit